MQAESTDNQRTETTPQSNTPMEPWMYDQVKYSRYWQHYQEMQRWMSDYMSSWKQNCQAQIGSTNPMSNQHLNRSRLPPGYDPYHWPPHHQSYPQVPPHNGKKTSRRHYRKHARKSNRQSHPPRGVHNDDVAMEANDEDHYELEVSEEMKAFFAKSEEFRRKRDTAKEKGQPLKWTIGDKTGKDIKRTGGDDSQNRTDEIVLSSSESDERQEEDTHQMETDAPKERPGVRRIVEMKELYGRHAAAIHGMETALQLQFDRHYDRKKPALWPIVPLRM